jgi:hypothetical protein
MKKKLIIWSFCIICYSSLYAQYTTDKVVGQKNVSVIDSMKTASYPYLLPIWGEKVVRKGFKIPKSAGLSAQYLWQQSDIIISNLKVGFNNGPLHSLDEIIRFDKAQTQTSGVNFRPDIWLFPFLNVYGIVAQSKTSTSINAGLWLPDDSSWKKVTSFDTKANFDATTIGFGLTPTVGIGGFFFALDANFSWSDISQLDKPAFAFVLGPRLGKNITFKNPERSLAIWTGGFRVQLNTGTSGNLNVADLFPIDVWQKKIDTGFQKVAQSQQRVDTWWDGLSETEKKNPVNIAKHNAANSALARAGQFLGSASQAVTNASNGTVQYSLDKKPKNLWNFLIGSQFQINRSWMIRAEVGFLASRTQFIGGIQYRFNL